MDDMLQYVGVKGALDWHAGTGLLADVRTDGMEDGMQVFASKDAEIADLKRRLKELQEQHAPCAGGL